MEPPSIAAPHGHLRRQVLFLVAAAICALSMWLYLQRVLIPFQISDAAAHGRPRGNLSDLYPRWLGARELLLHGRDPYSPEITREIQAGYYGRPLDPARPDDPKDEQRFAYPVYVVFPLAPTVLLPFPWVQQGFFWLLLATTILAVPLWTWLLRWSTSAWAQLGLALLTIGSPAVMQGLKLRQLSLFVAALVFTAVLLVILDHLTAAGFLFALATIKPQLIWLLLIWLAIWTVADWKRRYRLAVSFLITTSLLIAASELLLPHWLPRFWQALQDYQRYTGAGSVLDKMISPWMGVPTAILSVAMTLLICCRERNHRADSEAFTRVFCLVLAVTVLVAPTFAPYNQILLLPALLLLGKNWHNIRDRAPTRSLLRALTVAATAWPWLTSFLIATASFVLPPQVVQRSWTVPFWSVWLIPVGTAASMLVIAYRGSHSAPPAPSGVKC